MICDEQNRLTHPEYYRLKEMDWHFFLTIHPYGKGNPLSRKDHFGEAERVRFARQFMNFLRTRLRLRDKDLFWVATSEEEGKLHNAHLHILLRFRKGKMPSLHYFRGTATRCLAEMRKDWGGLDGRWVPVGRSTVDRERVASYFAKKDGWKDEKLFWFSGRPTGY